MPRHAAGFAPVTGHGCGKRLGMHRFRGAEHEQKCGAAYGGHDIFLPTALGQVLRPGITQTDVKGPTEKRPIKQQRVEEQAAA